MERVDSWKTITEWDQKRGEMFSRIDFLLLLFSAINRKLRVYVQNENLLSDCFSLKSLQIWRAAGAKGWTACGHLKKKKSRKWGYVTSGVCFATKSWSQQCTPTKHYNTFRPRQASHGISLCAQLTFFF